MKDARVGVSGPSQPQCGVEYAAARPGPPPLVGALSPRYREEDTGKKARGEALPRAFRLGESYDSSFVTVPESDVCGCRGLHGVGSLRKQSDHEHEPGR